MTPETLAPASVGFESEIRLLVALLLNGAVLASAWRFVSRRFGSDLMQRMSLTLLLYYVVQYLVIAALGLAGALAPVTIVAGGLLLSAAMGAMSGRRGKGDADPALHPPGAPAGRSEALVAWGAFLALIGFVAGVIYFYRFSPPLANDALTYHIPAAAQWLRTGRIGLYETWFYNPANTYSPLAGSMFTAWLIAPMNSDLMARFVEVGPLLMIFWALASLSRSLGASTTVSALVALSAALARPFISHTFLAKDDLFVTAFFLALVNALCACEARPMAAAIRAGLALGLMLATKYTALMSLPLVLLILDAPLAARWRGRHWAVFIALGILLAGPWYLRNLLLTGNPLFPTDVTIAGWRVFDGLFTILPSRRLHAWSVMTSGYYALPPVLAGGLIVSWLASVALLARRALRDPRARLVTTGPVIGIALFLLASPYAEMRFAYPSLVLLFAGLAVVISACGTLHRLIPPVLAGLVLGSSICTSFGAGEWSTIIGFALSGALVAAVGLGLWALVRAAPPLYRVGGVTVLLMVIVFYGYVYWSGYVRQYAEAPDMNWTHPNTHYESGQAWSFVRKRLPASATLAYTNTYLVHPLLGLHLDRRVVYAPTQPGVRHIRDLPHFAEPTTGEDIPRHIAQVTWRDADRATWLANLRASGAKFLYVGLRDIADPERQVDPPELAFARAMPEVFEPIYSDDAAIIFRVR